MATENARTIAQKKYDKEHTTQVFFKFNRNTDPDIIAWLENTENKSGYIKGLIREQIAKEERHAAD